MRVVLVVALVGTLAFALAGAGIGRRDFWPPDEARYAGVVADLQRGHGSPWIPRLNGELYPDKPPGYPLTIALAARVVGSLDEAAARWPSAVSGALLAALVAGWVTGVAGAGTGVLAGISLLGFGLFAWQMRYVQMDLLVAACTGAMMAAFFRSWAAGARPWCLAAWICAALGVFVKGPIAPIGILAAMGWAVGTGRPRAFFNVWSAIGLAAFLGMLGGAGWYVSSLPEGEEYLRTLLGRHVVERVRSGLAHEKPWYAYAGILVQALLPLTPLLGLLASRRTRSALTKPEGHLLGYCLVWAGAFVLILSVPAGKRSIYLLPALPPLAMSLALLVHALESPPRWVRVVALILSTALGLVGGAWLLAGSAPEQWPAVLTELKDRFGINGERALGGLIFEDVRGAPLMAAGAVLLLASGIAGACACFAGSRTVVGTLALASAIGVAAFAAWVAPELDRTQSRRGVADAVLSREARGEGPFRTFFFHHLDEGVAYYLGRVTPEVPPLDRDRGRLDPVSDREAAGHALTQALSAADARVIALAETLRKFELDEDRRFQVLDRIWVGKREFVVLGAAP